jgi:peptidoglycan-associated lipoprotein
MHSVVRPANGVMALSLRLLMILFVTSALLLPTGCSWFKKGEKKQEAAVTSPVSYAAPSTGQEGNPPANVAPEGPRPGDLLPFPEMKVIYFDFDRSNIRPDQLGQMELNLKYLKDHPEDKALVTGHCDERGTSEYNFVLGEKRASMVREYLVKGGITSNRIAVLSKGEEEPVALGHDEASWAKNRRCEFQRMF